MGAEALSSRAIIGRFYQTLEERALKTWTGAISMLFNSDQDSETYKWLGMVPALREWIGGRQAKGFRDNGMTIENKKFEATLEVAVDDLRRDKTGQVLIRIDELAVRAEQHWNKLLSGFIANGEAWKCYDGQYFFDTDHAEGDSGDQSNKIGYNVAVPAKPTPAEMEQAILAGVQQLLGFKDDEGEPMNDGASQFLVMVPVPFMGAAAAALKNPVIVDGSGSRTNTIVNIGGFSFEMAVNSRLDWTTKLMVSRSDGITKPFIRQEEEGVTIKAIAEGTEQEFKEDSHLYGVKSIRNVGYGTWQQACLVTLT